MYGIYRELTLLSKSFIEQGRSFTLLSKPTHEPCWIHPFDLVNRIVELEQNAIDFHSYDFQIAMGRLLVGEIPVGIEGEIEKINNVFWVNKSKFPLLMIKDYSFVNC